MTKTLKDAILSLPDLCATDGKPKSHKVMIYGANGWLWEAYESEEVESIYGPDIKCFGRVRGFEDELGYWLMSEIVRATSSWTEIKEEEDSQ